MMFEWIILIAVVVVIFSGGNIKSFGNKLKDNIGKILQNDKNNQNINDKQ